MAACARLGRATTQHVLAQHAVWLLHYPRSVPDIVGADSAGDTNALDGVNRAQTAVLQ